MLQREVAGTSYLIVFIPAAVKLVRLEDDYDRSTASFEISQVLILVVIPHGDCGGVDGGSLHSPVAGGRGEKSFRMESKGKSTSSSS